MGCKGGAIVYSFQYVRDKGVLTEKEYPYVGYRHQCLQEGGFKIKGYAELPKGDVAVLAEALHIQPISVSIDATNWSLYSGGIFSNCEKNLNSAVLLVAYDDSCWTIKNSWGITWGEKGYMRLARGDTCWIAQWASYSLPL